MKPNYTELVFSALMKPNLRNKIEEQLSNDLMEYDLKEDKLKFDWSEIVAEGKSPIYLDEEVDIVSFSGINVFNVNDQFVAEGRVGFKYDISENFFIAFWESLTFNLNKPPKPNNTEFGAVSDFYEPNLIKKLEEQLSNDLMEYGLKEDKYKFDWSESIAESGRRYLDVELIDFSYIYVFNVNDKIVAEGWMETIYDKSVNFIIAFWEFLHFNNGGKCKSVKRKCGIPAHVLNKLPLSTREKIDLTKEGLS
jgi:hypothetical protein